VRNTDALDFDGDDFYAKIATPVKPKAIRTAKRGKKKEPEKYVSPFRQPPVIHAEVTCMECNLPSVPGLSPFIGVERFIDGERKRVLRHEQCPDQPDLIANMIARNRQERRNAWTSMRRGGGHIYSTTMVEGEPKRTLVA